MQNVNTDNRRYDLDWLRVMAILLLVYFHAMMFYNSYPWHLKNAETIFFLDIITTFLHQWRMPLLLFISGVGTMYAFGKRSVGQFIAERNKRLLIPLIFSIVVIIPPQIYLEKIEFYNSYLEFYKSVFQFIPYPEGNLSWHHMWFVMYLFLYSLITIPLVTYLRGENAIKLNRWMEKGTSYDWGFTAALLPIFLSQIILRPYFPNETHALVDDWAFFTQNLFFFIAGLLIARNENIWERLKAQRRFHLSLGIISLGLMVTLMSISWENTQPYLRIELKTIWTFIELAVAWTWVLTILGYGRAYFNRRSSWIMKMNEGIYPFYILHQTVMIMLAYPLINRNIPIGLEYALLSNLTVFISAGIYLIFIRPFSFTRILFGMSRRKPFLKESTDKRVRQISINRQERNEL